LTGTGLDEAVVWYDDSENLGLRLLTIPIEDIFYGMLMVGLTVSIYEVMLQRRPQHAVVDRPCAERGMTYCPGYLRARRSGMGVRCDGRANGTDRQLGRAPSEGAYAPCRAFTLRLRTDQQGAAVNDARPEFTTIERLRGDLLASDQVIRVNDLGAGSRILDLPIREVSEMARTSLKPARQAQLIFRLARYFEPLTVLELGTSFGYFHPLLSTRRSRAQIFTVEGCPQTQRIARHHFDLSNSETSNYPGELPKPTT
jgi:hypothetical protein